MEISIQTDSFVLLKEAVESNCDKVRFGSEFCECKVPSLKALKEAYALTNRKGKDFIYVTPRVSNGGLEKIREQLTFLDGEATSVVVNDFGVLNILGQYSNLRPHLGRQLIHIPARCPWKRITEYEVGFLRRRKVEKIFYRTSLNYVPTIRFFRSYGVQGVDVDWIPRCFPYFNLLVENGLNLSVHSHLVPVTMTRRCHTARFLGEESLESCSKPCYKRAFLLKHDILGVELFLHGNVVFRFTQPSRKEVKQLHRSKVSEFVITMNPVTKIENKQEVDAFIQNLRL